VRLLALDTATEYCSAALLVQGRLLTREAELPRGHAEHILPMIDALLAEAGMSLHGLDAIAFGRGPGSFTGVRLAASITQGLAFGAGLGVIPVSDLRALAQRVFDDDPRVTRALVCNDARMQEVYWACFDRGEAGLARSGSPEHVGPAADVPSPIAGLEVAGVGRGFTVYPVLRALPGVTVRRDWDRMLPRAAEVARLAAPELSGGRVLGAEAAVPVYLRDDVARPAP
jgi:tRNA threonylcarbamoyladenosine biosynthesis protein TsaB